MKQVKELTGIRAKEPLWKQNRLFRAGREGLGRGKRDLPIRK